MNKMVTFCSIAETPWEGSMAQLLRKAGMFSADLGMADIIVFNGGADISTSIYGESPVPNGGPGHLSARDEREINIFHKFKNTGKLMVGICRGGQLLNCLNGGSLWQHVNNHGGTHWMTILETGEKMKTTSTHHQMMRPNWEKAKVIAVADMATTKVAMNDSYSSLFPYASFPDDKKDTEIVYYPETHSLCIQGHPEYVPGSEFADYCVGLIKQYLNEVQNVAA